MGSAPRWIQEKYVIATTQRTVDRQFLTLPTAVIRNLAGACAARALMEFPVLLYWLEININHEHMGIAPSDGSKEAYTRVIRFKQLYHRLFAWGINCLLGREGALFSSASRDVLCLDDESVREAFGYAITNPVKDGLVDRVAHWKGFSSYPSVALGEDTAYTYVDRTAWHQAGGERSGKPPEAFTKTVHLRFTPLPGTEKMSPGERQAQVRRQCRELEQKFREEREKEGKKVMSAARLEKLDYRDRPSTPAKKSPKPIFHGSSREVIDEFQEAYESFLAAYRAASIAYRNGNLDTEFPRGSFRPPFLDASG